MYSAGTSFVSLMCACASINPGVKNIPFPSITRSGAACFASCAASAFDSSRAIASDGTTRTIRLPFTNTSAGPNAGAPDPSITVTSRITSAPYGPACSGSPPLCVCGIVGREVNVTTDNNAPNRITSNAHDDLIRIISSSNPRAVTIANCAPRPPYPTDGAAYYQPGHTNEREFARGRPTRILSQEGLWVAPSGATSVAQQGRGFSPGSRDQACSSPNHFHLLQNVACIFQLKTSP